MARRRRVSGKPLMVASAGAAMIIGCGGGGKGNGGPIVTGNLVPPPSIEVCVVASPETAVVELDGVVSENGCTSAWEGQEIRYRVAADGYATQEGSFTTMEAGEGYAVALEPITDDGSDPEEPTPVEEEEPAE